MNDHPTPLVSDEELMQQARKRVALKRWFKVHLLTYVVVNVFLVFIFFITTRGWPAYFWPMWPMMGWGLGVAIHGAVVYFGILGFGNNDQVMKEYQKLKNAAEFDQKQ